MDTRTEKPLDWCVLPFIYPRPIFVTLSAVTEKKLGVRSYITQPPPAQLFRVQHNKTLGFDLRSFSVVICNSFDPQLCLTTKTLDCPTANCPQSHLDRHRQFYERQVVVKSLQIACKIKPCCDFHGNYDLKVDL